MRWRDLHVVLVAAHALGACSGGSMPADAGARADVVATYLPLAAFPAIPVPADNPSSPARAELGRQLFHDPVLSSDRAVACVTCHGEIWGLSDGLQYSIGVGGTGVPGPGRYGPTHTRRNASTLWNAAWRERLFWDGRAASLEDQVHFPMEATIELDRTPSDVARELRQYPAYVALFAAAFPGETDPITAENMARAIATFERTLVSDNAPFDQWARGDSRAIDADQLRGWQLFNEARCTECHVPPLFESERYARSPVAASDSADDAGRFEATHLEADRGLFRTPTLRNAGTTAPYFHHGAVATLESAVAIESAFRAGPRMLATDEIASVALFLRSSLMDITRVPDRPRIAPSGMMVPRDSLEIVRWQPRDGGL